jgi:predicted nucleotidyltransferase
MKEVILQKLSEIEQSEDVKILYACESGSRAWGFASPDSDFDVRFIYTRRLDDYLSITDTPDVLGLPVNEILDIGGWDIKKALKLFLKSNSPLYEWLQSPIIYRKNPDFTMELQSLMPVYYSLRSGGNHYLSMANNTLRDDLQLEQVKLKRYFYALRPTLACQWIIEREAVPPMEFDKLRVIITDEVIQKTIDDLLQQKQVVDEKEMIKPVKLLNDWLAETLSICKEKVVELPSEKHKPRELNEIFRKYIL